MMKRRDLVVLLAGAATGWPFPALAQQTAPMRTIGVFQTFAAPNKVAKALFAAFQQRLAALGWREGQNVRFDIRYGGGDALGLASLAAQLVKAAPDVILSTGGAPAIVALHEQAHSIPIVFLRGPSSQPNRPAGAPDTSR